MNYLIIVEGIADLVFIKDLIKYIFPRISFNISSIKNQEINLNYKDGIIRINYSKGFTAISQGTIKTKIQTAFAKKYKIILIQDADSEKTDTKYGGKRLRLKYINDFEKQNKVKLSSFLLPNHNDDGDLETLLLKIVNVEKYKKYIDCYSPYINCSKTISDIKYGNELLENKNKVYNYIRTYYGMELANESKRIYDNDLWDLTKPDLDPIKDFLTLHIQV